MLKIWENMSRSKWDVYCYLPFILKGDWSWIYTEKCFRKKCLNYAISHDFEIFKGMIHNIETLLKLSENVQFVEVYQDMINETAI